MSYTSIVITKYAPNVWFAKDNTLPGGVPGHFVSGWSGGVNNTLFTLKSKTGGIVYNNQLWSIFTYVDTITPANNFTPTSAIDLVVKLTQRDFFEYSSGGIGTVPTIQELANSLIPNLFGRANQLFAVAPSELGFTTVTPSFAFQNNKSRIITFVLSTIGEDVTEFEVSDYINNSFGFTISEIQTPVYIRVIRWDGSASRIFTFDFSKGKGSYGYGNTTATSASDFVMIGPPQVITESDVINTPNSVIYSLGDTTGDDYWEVANLQDPPYDLTDSGVEDADGNPKTYFYSYIDNGVLYYAQFIGTPGYYGIGELQFVEADFIDTTNDTVTPTPDLQQVTTTGNVTTNPIVINDPINVNKVTRGPKGETYTDPSGNTITNQYPDDAATGDAIYQYSVKTGTQTYAMLSDLPGKCVMIVAVGTILQSSELVGATAIRYVVGANTTYTEYTFTLNSITGIVGGFPIANGKKYFVYFN